MFDLAITCFTYCRKNFKKVHIFGFSKDTGCYTRGDDCCGVTAALDLALIDALEGGADGDDPAEDQYF